MDNRSFWAVIPASVLGDRKLSANAKILYGVISSMMGAEGYCSATNAQLAEAVGSKEDTITSWVSTLAKAGHIRVFVLPNCETGGKVRYIYPALPQPVFDAAETEEYPDKHRGTYPDNHGGVPRQTSGSLKIYNNNYSSTSNISKRGYPDVQAALIGRCQKEYGDAVAESMQRFLKMRTEIKKPVASQQSATMLYNRLVRLSGGDAGYMVAMLDTATERQWLSLYTLRTDEQPAGQPPTEQVDLRGMRIL